ncbi:MAG TPA: hypothetical protein VLB72_00420 [Burkholderiales bacterium]|nr:hypothetical protein [Burkholderiales bacterium]
MVFQLFLLVAAIALAGCASSEVSAPPHQPKANAAWRKSLGEATYITLAAGETREFKITPDLQTFGFPEGISYFVGIALARSEAARTLTLRTLPLNPLRPREAHVFVPRVAVVAPDGSVSRYVELEFQPNTQWVVQRLIARNVGWQGSLALAPGETRIAVYTATLLPQTLRLPMPSEVGGFWYVPSGPTGVVEITLNDN